MAEHSSGKGDTPPPVPGSDHAEQTRGNLDRSLAMMRFLRANCPWDAEQTHESLVPYLLEESHEVVDAIHSGDAGQLEGELGDLLLNLAFQIVVAEEAGTMTADSVTRRIEEKMRRRHPHLYGLGPKESWESIKARERAERAAVGAVGAGDGPEAGADRDPDANSRSGSDAGREDEAEQQGILSGVATGLDPLTQAFLIQDRVAGVGFDWEDHRGALAKVVEELGEVRHELDSGGDQSAIDEELGDLLFAVVNLVRLAGSHPFRALTRANRKFTARFAGVERLARERGIVMEEASLEELDVLWDAVKAEQRASAGE